MAQVECLEVCLHEDDADKLVAFELDYPSPGRRCDGYAIDVGGWVVGRESAAQQVVVRTGSRPIRASDAWIARPLAAQDPRVLAQGTVSGGAGTAQRTRPLAQIVQEAGLSGFHASVGGLSLPPEFELHVDVALEDRSSICVPTIRGRRPRLQTGHQPRRHPVLVTSLGRSGSTWLMRLLSEHPQVVVHRRYPYETYLAIHTMRLLQVLTIPANPLRSQDMYNFAHTFESIGPLPLYCYSEDPQMHAWLRQDYVEDFARFALQTIDRFYDVVATSQQKPGSCYFAEKALLARDIGPLFSELYPAAREIFLVRDFRDVFCSRRAFKKTHDSGLTGLDDNEAYAAISDGAQSLLEAWRSRSAGSCLIRYEDLVLRPIDTLQEVFRYLAVDSSRKTVDEVLRRSSGESDELQQHRTTSVPEQSIGRWQQELNPTQMRACRDWFANVLTEFGYGVSAHHNHS